MKKMLSYGNTPLRKWGSEDLVKLRLTLRALPRGETKEQRVTRGALLRRISCILRDRWADPEYK